jgi:reverse gyrase
VVELVKRHGGGALVFVPQTAGVEGAEELAKALKEESGENSRLWSLLR